MLASDGGAPAPRRPAAQFSGCAPRTAGAPAPRRPAAQFSGCSPRTAGPQPRDVLRLTLRLWGEGSEKGGEAPSEFDGMAILVTGAFGCIGAWVVKRLLAAGERPVVYDLGDDPWRMRMIVGSERLHDVAMIRGDIADRDAVVRVVGEHDITRIIHLAAWQVPLCRQDPSRG